MILRIRKNEENKMMLMPEINIKENQTKMIKTV